MEAKKHLIYLLSIIGVLCACNKNDQWEGQAPVQTVSTLTVPIQLQHKTIYDLGDSLFCSNDFEGARLNGIARINDTLISTWITPENSPINMSPWFAFKLWSNTPKTIYVQLTYPEHAAHRYYPKLSYNGTNWENIDSTHYIESEKVPGEQRELPKSVTLKLEVNRDTLWVSGQELITSSVVQHWIDKLSAFPYVDSTTIGKSHEGRAIQLMKIGESNDELMNIVISRQHPPEVTGFLAMQAFIETICADNELANAFRKKYNTYVVPLMNPDGVDNGHWRHNKGGVDLNRDWAEFNQPETMAVRQFMENKVEQTGGKFYFGIDFHSTWEDIYYTMDPKMQGNMPGLVPAMIEASGKAFDTYVPNIKPRDGSTPNITSYSYFFHQYGAESLVFEVGDNTPRDFLRKKGEITALKLMELMMQ